MPDDIGRFVGRYLQAVAALVVLGMVVSMFRGTVRIELSFAALVTLLGGVLLVTALVPLVLLLSRRARDEFRAA